MATKLANRNEASAPEKSRKLIISKHERHLTGRGRETSFAGKITAENGAPAAPGTRHAAKDTFQSRTPTRCPAAAEASQCNRKIGQFRRGRRSTALTLPQVRNIIAGAQFALAIGAPLNRHTTIHFEAAGIADPVAALRAYTKLMRDWLRTQGAPFAYVWVREAGERKGEHAHLLIHVPADLATAFARRERGWRKRIGARRALGAFRSTPVGRSYRHAEAGIQFGQHYSDHLAEIVGYLAKGAEPRAATALGLTRVDPCGGLWSKRTGMSENIGRAARRRAVH